MVEIIYKEGLYAYRTSEKLIRGGMVATFTGNREVGICDNKTRPVGFFVQDFQFAFKPLKYTDISSCLSIAITVGQAELETDIFEPCKYKINDLLFCSKKGKITNEQKSPYSVGIVNLIKPDRIGFITAFYPFVLDF